MSLSTLLSPQMMQMLRREVLPLVLAGLGGALALYIFLLARGHLPLWFGPERLDWSPRFWSERANEVMKELQSGGFALYRPQESNRNFLSVLESTKERRVRRALFFSRKQAKLIGVLHFGADCEGPPRCVHGGCIAAVVDAVLGVCAYRTARIPCLTANLNVNYVDKLPLGATCLIECWHVSSDGIPVTDTENIKTPMLSKKLVFEYKLTSLSGQKVFSRGTALFVNAIAPGSKSVIPPFLRFNR